MRICVVGAGAIGGYIGARLAAAGKADVCTVARGATLSALRKHGWRLEEADGLVQAPAHASDKPAELGVQDAVVIAVKGPALAQVAREIAPLLGPQTMVVPAMNGVPWWFGYAVPALGSAPLESVDPGGAIARAIPLSHAIGCVVHVSASTVQPGFVSHNAWRRVILGEPSGERSERMQGLADELTHAGLEVVQSADIRGDIWYKLWGQMTVNPVSAITGATVDRIIDDPLVRAFCANVMREAAVIGERIGCPVSESPEQRLQVAARLGAFKTSMLQDVEAGRQIELDAIVGVVRELGARLGWATPCLDALYGLARLHGRVHGVYPAE